MTVPLRDCGCLSQLIQPLCVVDVMQQRESVALVDFGACVPSGIIRRCSYVPALKPTSA
tara:strand:- start:3813 stop:3989 length:177 start_codon:yes stop_codon:yes gene_type:complete